MPTDITAFFGKKGPTSRTTRKKTASSNTSAPSVVTKSESSGTPAPKAKMAQKSKPVPSKRKPLTIDEDDDDNEFVPLDEDEDDDEEIIELSGEPSPRKKRGKVQAIDSESEDEVIPAPKRRREVKSQPEPKAASKAAPKTASKAAPKAATKATAAKPVPKAQPKKTAAPAAPKPTSINTHITAQQVLDSIPDCELPEVNTDEKVNFWAKKAELDKQTSDESFEQPEGKPDCLAGLTIVFTGVLPHINREDCDYLAGKYGAKVTKSISKKTSVVVLGSDAGPKKIEKIKLLGIKHIDEEGFCKLIEGMPEAGGDNNKAAQKVLQKREDEACKAQEVAEEEAREAELKEKAKREKLAKAQALRKSDPEASVDEYIKPEDRPDSEKLWTVKYAPTKINQICGNKGQVQKIIKWLINWDQNKRSKFKYFGESFPAILISGPPGIGKTTAAHIIAKDMGYTVVEKNASDVRSKSLLNDTVREVLDNTSVVGFFNQRKNPSTANNNKTCLVMDEVDGMSSGDMGGVGALANFCRKTSIPIILICNDKSLPKMRPFDKVAMDVQFRRPDATSIKSRILTIALREKIKIPPEIIERLVEYTKNDIRQIINLLSTATKTVSHIDSSNYNDVIKGWEKNVALKTFDIAGRYLSSALWNPNSGVDLNGKIGLYFDDYSFVPLMVHENYLNTKPVKSRSSSLEHLKLVAKAADSISEADLVDRKIHSSEQQWSLMPFHAVTSSVRPSSFVNGQIMGRINFTSFLGNNSKRNKYERLLTDLNYHTKLATLTNKSQLRLNYFHILSEKLCDPLLKSGAEGISEVIDIMDSYYLTKEDWEYLLDFGIGDKNVYKLDIIIKKLPTAVKSSFTRKYNAAKHPVAIYRVGVAGTGSSKGVSTQTPDFEDAVNDDTAAETKPDEDEDNGEDEDISKDKLIKQKKATAKKPAAKKKAAAGGGRKKK